MEEIQDLFLANLNSVGKMGSANHGPFVSGIKAIVFQEKSSQELETWLLTVGSHQ